MPADPPSILAVLEERVRQRPDECAYTFIDYQVDPAGLARNLTWSQVGMRARIVAAELALSASPGDRAAVLAPQGLDYIVGVLGAIAAGFIAVPLPVPESGRNDERVSAALKDCSPAVILTTSAAAAVVDTCVQGLPSPRPTVVEIDALDLYTAPAGQSGAAAPITETALLQYTSGSTRAPAGVMVTQQNIVVNLTEIIADYFAEDGGVPPPDLTGVSWLPLYHDMGLQTEIFLPILGGYRQIFTSPAAFLQKPARWITMLAENRSWSAAPNFAFDLAVRRTSDDDMAGLDLGNVHTLLSGSERVHAATIRRFTERFSRFNFPASALKPSYGLAEATVYVVSANPGRPPTTARFDYEKLSAGHATRCTGDDGSELVGHGTPRACTVRIVDPETRTEKPAGEVGEIWVHGANVADGYWRNPQLSERTFGGSLVDPSPGTPQEPWLRTGDLGVLSDGDLFIIGRIKDVLIVDGRNHYPDDIEATVQGITAGRVAAFAVPKDGSEQLVVVVELKKRGGPGTEMPEGLRQVEREVTSAVSTAHGLRVADLVLAPPGSIPVTTSGKVRRAACAERYRQGELVRLDASE